MLRGSRPRSFRDGNTGFQPKFYQLRVECPIRAAWGDSADFARRHAHRSSWLQQSLAAECDELGHDRQSAFCFGQDLYYCPNQGAACSTNNGDLLSVALPYLGAQQSFSYDAYNRLLTASESSSATGWSQTYGYDSYGNRWVAGGITTSPFTPEAATNFDSNNRLQIEGTPYDASGNLKVIGGQRYERDADGNIAAAAINSSVYYAYDADDHRVLKQGVGGATVYVYDVMGQLAEEYSTLSETSPCATCYLTADNLGSTRVITNPSGAAISQHDYLPFGEEIPLAYSGRANLASYQGGAADDVNQKFTGKERDSESGLDYFGARYYGSALGRFTSADPLLNSGQPWDPQTWNRYSYTLNNPLRYTDPLGLWTWGKCSGNESECAADRDRFRTSVKNATEALKGLDPKSNEAKALKATLDKIGDDPDSVKNPKGSARVNFGYAGETDGRPNLGLTFGKDITINYEATDNFEKNMTASEASALDAGLTAHEGTHVIGPGLFGVLKGHFEHPAYYVESVTYQGLHNTDRGFGLWNESWRKLDQTLLENKREAAIQQAIHPPKSNQ